MKRKVCLALSFLLLLMPLALFSVQAAGAHLGLRQEPQVSSPFLTQIEACLQSWVGENKRLTDLRVKEGE